MKKFLKKMLSEKTKKFKTKENIEVLSIFEIGDKVLLYKAICQHGLVSGHFKITDKKFVRNEDYTDGLWAYRLNVKDMENQWWGEMVIKKAPDMAPLSFDNLISLLNQDSQFIRY